MNATPLEERRALEAILEELTQAWNAGDAQRFAAPFAPEAVQVNIFGAQLRGRQEIAERHDRIFKTIFRESINAFEIIDADLAATNVMLARISSAVTVPHGPLQGELRTIASLVLRRTDTRWEILLFHNTRVAADAVQQPEPPNST